MKLLSHILYKCIPIFSLLKRLFLKFYANGFAYISFVQELLLKFSTNWYTCLLFSRSVKLFSQVANPTHEQIKYVQSSIKSTQLWSSIKNFFLKTNPLPTNPIDSKQLSLKLWLEINHALEASWKYLNNHVWCCVRLYLCVLLILLMVDCL